jgi:methyltransferase (TIGR00027 family)
MNEQAPLIRNISDTALWVAAYRAYESERPDAHFNDPFARKLAGKRGEEIANSMTFLKGRSWPFVARTWLIDKIVNESIQKGIDTVVNLAAGLDTRPYRMTLPATLRWIEVDLPGILSYKEEILDGEKPKCLLERVRLDLSDIPARRELFSRLGNSSQKALVITEGLVIYLTAEEVASLAKDLIIPSSFKYWIVDLVSPGLLRMMQKESGPQLDRAGAPFKFAPEEGAEFFTPFGWRTLEVNSLIKTAGRLNRLSFFMKLLSKLPDSNGPKGSRPWSGVCLYEKIE